MWEKFHTFSLSADADDNTNQPHQPMKLTLIIHVYDVTTASEFDALIGLLESMKARIADPAPGHPELPLDITDDTRWCVVEQTAEQIIPSGLPDLTCLELPLPDGLPELPDLPEGKTRWAYRGRFSNETFTKDCERFPDRTIKYFSESDEMWIPTITFSGDLHHIEAV